MGAAEHGGAGWHMGRQRSGEAMGDRVFDSMDKALLKERFTGLLRDRRDTLAGVQADARAGTRVDGDHRPENRGERAAVTSQGYLAHGLTARMAELDTMLEALALVRTGPCARIASGALVRLADEADEERLLYILPGGQGDRLGPVVVVSPRAPIVRALSGAGVGDARALHRGGTTEWVEVLGIR